MNININKAINKQKMSIFVILCIIAMIGMIGYTYSYFQAEVTNSVAITGEAASVNLQLTVTRIAPSSTKKLIPQLDSAITKAVVGRNGSCIDDNDNAVCQVYRVTLKNAGSSTTEVDGYVELNAGNNPNLKWTIVSGDGSSSEPTLERDIYSYSSTILTTKELYQVNETKNYYLVVWISETGYAQMDSGQFTGVVRFGTHEEGGSSSSSTLATETLNNLKELGFTGNVSNTELTTFTGSSEEDGTSGIYAAEDDLGTSYYFRGAVENNYVYFANKYWRIIRINGDGTVRMIYDGTTAHANGESSTDRRVGTSAFNSSYNDNAYVGYMYGAAGADSYAAAHTNTNNSTMKIYLEGDTTPGGWYKTNIVDPGYSDYVADAIYCSDRTLVPSSNSIYQTFIENAYGMTMEEFAAEGYTYGRGYGGQPDMLSFYGYWNRAVLTDLSGWSSFTPTLKCSQANDRFTVNETVGIVAGNAKNKYPVGLITTDEAIFAGGYSVSNESYYLYTGNWYWTMSPAYFGSGFAYVGGVGSGGDARYSSNVFLHFRFRSPRRFSKI